jgi:hypothetical protein
MVMAIKIFSTGILNCYTLVIQSIKQKKMYERERSPPVFSRVLVTRSLMYVL